MGSLLPNEPLIYERADGIVFARYRDPPHNKIPRWVVGGDADAIKKLEGRLDFEEYLKMVDCAKTNYTLKKQLDKALVICYTIRNETEKETSAK